MLACTPSKKTLNIPEHDTLKDQADSLYINAEMENFGYQKEIETKIACKMRPREPLNISKKKNLL